MRHVHSLACWKNHKYCNCRYAYERALNGPTGLYDFVIKEDDPQKSIALLRQQEHPQPSTEFSRVPLLAYDSPFPRNIMYFDLDTRPAALLSERTDPIDARTADFNQFLSNVLGFNIHVQLLSCEVHAAMVMFYLVKYLTKPLTNVASAVGAINHARNREKFPSKSETGNATEKLLAQRLGNYVLGMEEVSAQLAALCGLGYRAEMSSHGRIIVNVGALVQVAKEERLKEEANAGTRPEDSCGSSGSPDDSARSERSSEESTSDSSLDIYDSSSFESSESEPKTQHAPAGATRPQRRKQDERRRERGTVCTDYEGEPHLRSESIDYFFRDPYFEDLNAYMYRGLIATRMFQNEQESQCTTAQMLAETVNRSRAGRPLNARYRFHERHPLFRVAYQVMNFNYPIPSLWFVPRWSHHRNTCETPQGAREQPTRHAITSRICSCRSPQIDRCELRSACTKSLSRSWSVSRPVAQHANSCHGRAAWRSRCWRSSIVSVWGSVTTASKPHESRWANGGILRRRRGTSGARASKARGRRRR